MESNGHYTGAKVLVTGGAGFIGSHLVEGLIEAGCERVVVVDDFSLGSECNLEGADGPRLIVERGDCGDPTVIERAASHGRYDFCFNLAVVPLPASLVRPRETIEINVAATAAICELGRAGGYGRLVQYSSSEVYGTAVHVPMREDHPQQPTTPYAASKVATDVVALSYMETFGLEVSVIRPFNTFGPRQNMTAYAGLIPTVITDVISRAPVTIHGDGDQTRDYVYVRDVVDATLALAKCEGALGRAVNIGSGKEHTVKEIVRLTLEAIGEPEWPIEHGSNRLGDVRRLLADVSLAKRLIAYEPSTSLADGLRPTVRAYLNEAT